MSNWFSEQTRFKFNDVYMRFGSQSLKRKILQVVN